MAFSLAANTELVAVQWMLGVPGFSAGMCATQLPKDESSWSATGFATVTTLSGAPNNYTGARGPVLMVDCWTISPGSNKAPWGQANAMAEAIVRACAVPDGRTLSLPNGYPNARVLQAWVVTEPRRVFDDAADTARYSLNLAIAWIQP